MSQPASAPVTGTATVSVGMIYPSPYILRTFVRTKERRMVGGVVLEEDGFQETGDRFVVNGNKFSPLAKIELVGDMNVAVTHGCPKDLWELWWDQNKASNPLCTQGLIFACEKEDGVRREASSRATMKSGLEGMDPDAPPPEFASKGLKKADNKSV